MDPRTLAHLLVIALGADLLAIAGMAATDALGAPQWAAPTVGVATFIVSSIVIHRHFGASIRRVIDRATRHAR